MIGGITIQRAIDFENSMNDLESQLYYQHADLYDSASFEAKKMIVSQLIRRIDVYRGYQIHVDFNFDLAQYLENSDELAC